MDEHVWEFEVGKVSSERPIEDVQIILQTFVWVKRKPSSTLRDLCLLPLEEAKKDRLEDTPS